MSRLITNPKRKITLSLSEMVCTQVDLHFYDPIKRKPQYGKWSELVETLLINYLKNLPKDDS